MNNLNCLKNLFCYSKTKSKVLFLIITLAMTLVTTVSISLHSVTVNYYETLANKSGEQHVSYYNLTEEELSKITSQSKLKEYGTSINIGFLDKQLQYNENSARIGYLDNSFIDLYRIKLQRGRLPQNVSEIAVEERVLSILGVKPELNQDIKLKINIKDQNGAKQVSKLYRIVGILDNYEKKRYSNQENIYSKIPSILISEKEAQSHIETKAASYNVLAKMQSGFNTREDIHIISSQLHLDDKYEYNINIYRDRGFLGLWFLNKYGKFYNHELIGMRLFMFLASLLICMLFSLIIFMSLDFQSKKQQLGLLRAVGATSKQITKLLYKKISPIVLTSMILGVSIGTLVSSLFYKAVGNYLTNYSAIGYFTLGLKPVILSLTFGVISCYITITFFVALMCKESPIKVLKTNYRQNKGRIVSTSKLTSRFSLKLVKRTIQLNKVKSFLLIVSLAISISISYIIINDYHAMAVYAKYIPKNTITISKRSNSINNSNLYLLQPSDVEVTGFNEVTYKQLLQLKEVKNIEIENQLRHSYSILFNKTKLDKYLNILKDLDMTRYNNIDINDNLLKLNKLGLSEDYDVMAWSNLCAIETHTLSLLSPILDTGNIDIQALENGLEVVLCLPTLKQTPNSIGFGNQFSFNVSKHTNNTLKVGDSLVLARLKTKNKQLPVYKNEVTNLELEQVTVKIGAIIKKSGYFKLAEDTFINFTSPTILVHHKALNKWLNISNYNEFNLILHKDVNDEELAKKINNTIITDNNATVISSTANNNRKKVVRLQNNLMYLSIILVTGLMGCLGIFYAVRVNMSNKGKELGILRSVGMTKSQLGKCLNYEVLFYSITANVVAILFCIAYSIWRYLNGIFICYITWWQAVPWLAIILVSITSTLFIYLINHKYINKFVEKSIISNIKYTN